MVYIKTVKNSDITIEGIFDWEYSVINLLAEQIDPVLIKHKESIKNFGFITYELQKPSRNSKEKRL